MKLSERYQEITMAIHFIDLLVRVGVVLSCGMKLIFPDMLSVLETAKKVRQNFCV